MQPHLRSDVAFAVAGNTTNFTLLESLAIFQPHLGLVILDYYWTDFLLLYIPSYRITITMSTPSFANAYARRRKEARPSSRQTASQEASPSCSQASDLASEEAHSTRRSPADTKRPISTKGAGHHCDKNWLRDAESARASSASTEAPASSRKGSASGSGSSKGRELDQ